VLEIDILAWVFLLLGFLLVVSGSGYLIYYYTSIPVASVSGEGGLEARRRIMPTATPGVVQSWAEKLAKLRRIRGKKVKARKREELFGTFDQKSTKIPHVERLISGKTNGKKSHLPKLNQLAKRYSEHKEEIKPGLRGEEKSVFAKLESIAKQTKGKRINEVVDKSEAKDIFEKLKRISQKRKK